MFLRLRLLWGLFTVLVLVVDCSSARREPARARTTIDLWFSVVFDTVQFEDLFLVRAVCVSFESFFMLMDSYFVDEGRARETTSVPYWGKPLLFR